jgi:hypothetical protein
MASRFKFFVERWREVATEVPPRVVAMLTPRPLLFMLVFVLALGAGGVWIAWAMNHYGAAAPRDVYLSTLTFAAAVAISGAFEGTYSPRVPGLLKILAAGAALFAVVAQLYFLVPAWLTAEPSWTSAHNRIAALPVAVGVLPAVVVWWFFNSMDSRFEPDSPADAAAGGDPLRSLVS